jgi:radical SAM superfamily enzyme YgiQ (UPF0313 family)
MSILMINPNRFRPHIAPIGLEYVCNSLLRENIEFDLIDLNFEHESVIYRKLRENNVELVGITVRNLDSGVLAKTVLFQPDIKKLVNRIKNTRDCKVVLGGIGFSILPREILEYSGADFGVIGYGEEALPRLVRALRQGGDLSKIDNLIRRENGKFPVNPISTGDYQNIPTRRRNIVRNLSYYRVYGLGSIEPMRGCPKRCGYCCEPNIVGRKMVTHKIANVIEELIELKTMGIHHVLFCDSEFNLCNREYLFDFCEQLNRRQVGITWTAYMYPDPKTVSHKLLTLMKNAGCREVLLGSDSGSDEILAGMGRQHTAGDSVIFTEYLRKAGIHAFSLYLIGWPGESTKTIEETFDHIKRCRSEEVVIEAGIRIYPDTKIARIAMDEGVIDKDTNLMDPEFYNPDQVLREFIPYIRRRARDMENTILYPTGAINFINLLIRNFFLLEGYTARGIGDFTAHMNNLPKMKKLKILGRTALDFALPFRRRFVPLARGDKSAAKTGR